MEARIIEADGVRRLESAGLTCPPEDAAGVTWVDLEVGDPETDRVLRHVFALHPRAVEDCKVRNTTSKLHVYDDHSFLVLHAPELGALGHVHSIELDLFVGPGWLVTVHGPLNPVLDPGVALLETRAVAARLDEGRWLPTTVDELVHAIVTRLNRRMDRQLAQLRSEAWTLEREVTAGRLGDPEAFLEEMFRVRLALQALRTMAALDHEVYGRLARLRPFGKAQSRRLMVDVVDQFERVMHSADIQIDYLQGVIDFYQTRINTKMTVAAERLAVIAGVTLPVTAVSSVVGMNVIVSSHTHWAELTVLLALMGGMSVWLLIWARRQGWW